MANEIQAKKHPLKAVQGRNRHEKRVNRAMAIKLLRQVDKREKAREAKDAQKALDSTPAT